MAPYMKDLGELSSIERLHTTRLDAAAKQVLAAIEIQRGWVSPSFLVGATILPLSTVLSALVELASAGLIKVQPSSGHDSIEAAPTVPGSVT